MLQKVITIILGLVIVGGLAWYINKNYVEQSTSPSDTETPEGNLGENSTESNSQLVYVTFGAATEIWQTDLNGTSKKLYTDADEALKIKKISNLSTGTSEVLAIVSKDNNSAGKLEVIDLNTAKAKVLKELFPTPTNFSISPDGERIIYTRFSNVEESYGYTIFLEDTNGSGLSEIANSSSEIIYPCWGSNSKTIYYGKTVGVNAEIIRYDLETKKSKTIFSTEKVIDWLSITPSDKIIISERKIGEENAGEISFLDQNGQEKASIVKYSGGKASFVYLSAGQNLAYLVAQYKVKIDEKTSGQIYILNIKNSEKSAIKKGVQILGWRKNEQ